MVKVKYKPLQTSLPSTDTVVGQFWNVDDIKDLSESDAEILLTNPNFVKVDEPVHRGKKANLFENKE